MRKPIMAFVGYLVDLHAHSFRQKRGNKSVRKPITMAIAASAVFSLTSAGLITPVKSDELKSASLPPSNVTDVFASLRQYIQSIEHPETALATAKTSRSSESSGGNRSSLWASAQSIEKPEEARMVLAQASSSPAEAIGDATYVGTEKCIECHKNQHETFSKTLMGAIFLKKPRNARERLGCEACHGPGSRHAVSKTADQGDPGGLIAFSRNSPRPVEERNGVCLSCHEKGKRTHWRGSQHETRGLACTSCHQIMDKVSPKFQLVKSTVMETCFQCHKDRRAQLYRSSHMPLREGKVICTDCHNPHGTSGDSLLLEGTINKTCYKCHAEKRGPFLWEHFPVRENCLNCHEPHGSMNRSLLRVSVPRLCQQCHSQRGHPSSPQNPASRFAFNRGCANCHGMIHGSNHLNGNRFHR